MHYLKWKRVVLFSFHYYCQQAIRKIQQKLWRTAAPQTPRFLQACQNIIFFSSNRPEVFCIKGVLKNFSKLPGNHLCQGLFFNKVAGLSPAALLKKRLWHRCFPVSFVKFLRTPFLTEHLWWLLLFFVTLIKLKLDPFTDLSQHFEIYLVVFTLSFLFMGMGNR